MHVHHQPQSGSSGLHAPTACCLVIHVLVVDVLHIACKLNRALAHEEQARCSCSCSRLHSSKKLDARCLIIIIQCCLLGFSFFKNQKCIVEQALVHLVHFW